MPIMSFHIEHFGAGDTELGWLISTHSLMQLICAPIWGILSDRCSVATLALGLLVSLFGLRKQVTGSPTREQAQEISRQ